VKFVQQLDLVEMLEGCKMNKDTEQKLIIITGGFGVFFILFGIGDLLNSYIGLKFNIFRILSALVVSYLGFNYYRDAIEDNPNNHKEYKFKFAVAILLIISFVYSGQWILVPAISLIYSSIIMDREMKLFRLHKII